MDYPKPIWTKSKWTKNDLDGQTVEFDLVEKKRGYGVHGIGEFVVSKNPAGLLFVQIELILMGRNQWERVQVRYYLPQLYVDRIRKHPDQRVAAFQIS